MKFNSNRSVMSYASALGRAERTLPLIREQLRDMFPAWDAPEGIFFSNEVLWNIQNTRTTQILARQSRTNTTLDPVSIETHRRTSREVRNPAGRYACIGAKEKIGATYYSRNHHMMFHWECCHWKSIGTCHRKSTMISEVSISGAQYVVPKRAFWRHDYSGCFGPATTPAVTAAVTADSRVKFESEWEQ